MRPLSEMDAPVFAWKPGAAKLFRFTRRLERHEKMLVDEIARMLESVSPFAPGGVLADRGRRAEAANAFMQKLRHQEKAIQEAGETLPVEAAAQMGEALGMELATLVQRAYDEQRRLLSARLGIGIAAVGTSVDAGGVYLVRPSSGPSIPGVDTSTMVRGVTSGTRALLLAQGEWSRVSADVLGFILTSHGVRRLALVHVRHVPGEALVAEDAEAERGAIEQRAGGLIARVSVLRLDEGARPGDPPELWGEALAEEVLLASAWIAQVDQAPASAPRLLRAGDRSGEEPLKIGEAVSEWLRSERSLLWLAVPDTSLVDAVADQLAVAFDAPERRSSALVDLSPLRWRPDLDPYQHVGNLLAGRENSGRLADLVARAMRQGRLVALLRVPSAHDDGASTFGPGALVDLLKGAPGARGVLVGPARLIEAPSFPTLRIDLRSDPDAIAPAGAGEGVDVVGQAS
jgi:hypothetical protein